MAGSENMGGSTPSPVPTRTVAGPRPPSRFHTYLYSGSRKHVIVGLLIVSSVMCAPWFLMTSGSKHQNHADYMDAAEKARQSRLSSSAASR